MSQESEMLIILSIETKMLKKLEYMSLINNFASQKARRLRIFK
jgi:hypothetical protein